MLMMLSSADRHENVARCEGLGIGTYLTKPIRRTELLNAILTAVHAVTETDANSAKSRHSVEPCRQSLRLLLTEDNAVNQRLAVRLLEKRGHTVVVANNGREALAAILRDRFDAVLMDVQMPEMDGLEATRLIRARERDTGRHLPIVAMTAHAMKGDRERCLQAGMDGYISKPLHPSDLFEAVESLAGQGAATVPPRVKETMQAAFDQAAALHNVGGDLSILKEIIAIFVEEYPTWLTAIREGLDLSDAGIVRRNSHALKGAVSVFGPTRALELVQRLELMAREDDLSNADDVFKDVERAIRELQPVLLAVS
jgi:CheY-like chemotaxis protein